MSNIRRKSLKTIKLSEQTNTVEDWLDTNKQAFMAEFHREGAVLLRGFPKTSLQGFQDLIESNFGSTLKYEYGSSPRTLLTGKIYTSTEYPASSHIPLHNENSYTLNWPAHIAFMCMTPPDEGGRTPIADSHAIYQAIPSEIREKFERLGLCYIRNYDPHLDVSWQSSLGTDSKKDVETYCIKNNILWKWKEDGCLRTKQTCQSVVTHPRTNQKVWFNQANLFHISTLPLEVKEYLLEIHGLDGLPRNVIYGDGSQIEDETIKIINDIYTQESTTFDWEEGDILFLDNVLWAHGRTPYSGARKIVVGMA